MAPPSEEYSGSDCGEELACMVKRVSDALVVEAVVVRATWADFDETVAGLIDRLVAAGRLPAERSGDAVQHIAEREAMASTAMVDIGVSIPHARFGGIDGIAAAMAVAPTAVYQLADGLPIAIVVLALSSPDLQGEHLNFLSSVSILLQSARVRQRLRNAASADEVLQIVRRNETPRI
jgi:mannitol/fructose-specific phosphotransferase system IIA component (Ntr-type)